MKKITAILLNLILIVSLLAVVSCKPGGSSAADGQKDTLVKASIGEPDSLDPHYAYDNASGEVLFNVNDTLVAYKIGSTSEFVPSLSVNIPNENDGTIREGGTVYEFTIRKGVKFHEGGDLTPEDVEYTFERAVLFDPDGSPIWMFISPFFNNFRLKYVIEEYVGDEWGNIFDEAEGAPKAGFEQKFVDFYNDVIDPMVEVEGDKVIFKLAKPFPPFLHVLGEYSSWSQILDKEWSMEQGIWDGKAEGWWKYYNIKKEDSP